MNIHKIHTAQEDDDDDNNDSFIQDIVDEALKPVPCSADCVQSLLQRFPNTVAKDWKRRSKKKDAQGNWVRTFENVSTGAKVNITESKSGFTMQVINSPAGGHGPTSQASLGQEPVVMLVPLVPPQAGTDFDATYYDAATKIAEIMGDWSGRMVFAREEDEGEDGDEINFTCGPETKNGYLDDTYDGGAYAKLNLIFSDFERDIGAAENYHQITAPAGMSLDTLWGVIQQRLLAAGAMPFGSPQNGSPQATANAPIYYVAQIIHLNNLEEFGDGDPDMLGHWHVAITPRDYWLQYHCMADNTPNWVQTILDEVGFPAEDMENSYTLTPQQMLAVRNDNRFYESPEFTQFLSGGE